MATAHVDALQWNCSKESVPCETTKDCEDKCKQVTFDAIECYDYGANIKRCRSTADPILPTFRKCDSATEDVVFHLDSVTKKLVPSCVAKYGMSVHSPYFLPRMSEFYTIDDRTFKRCTGINDILMIQSPMSNPNDYNIYYTCFPHTRPSTSDKDMMTQHDYRLGEQLMAQSATLDFLIPMRGIKQWLF